MQQHAGVDMRDEAAVRAKAESLGLMAKFKDKEGKLGPINDWRLVNEVLESTVAEHLSGPIFVLDYPSAICPLTRRKADDPDIALRFEAFVCGMEWHA